MTSLVPSLPREPADSLLEIVTGDDVRRIVECRLRWYGLDQIVLEDISRDGVETISVVVRDLARGARVRTAYRTTLGAGSESKPARHSMAA